MPFVANTPESLLNRTDSKDPASTCHGVTGGGKPCRNPIKPIEGTKKAKKQQLLDAGAAGDERLYCSRHKDQAAAATASASPSPGPGPRVDTLTHRLGLAPTNGSAAAPSQRQPKRKKEFTFCCCFTLPNPLAMLDGDDSEPAPRPSSRPNAAAAGAGKPTSSKLPRANSNPAIPPAYRHYIPSSASPETEAKLVRELEKPVSEDDVPGYIYIFWLTPESALGEKPVQRARTILGETGDDEEYTQPQGDGTRGGGLLGPDGRPNLEALRRPSDVLGSFADAVDSLSWLEGSRLGARLRAAAHSDDDNDNSDGATPSSTSPAPAAAAHPNDNRKHKKNTLLLKIGRATNVQRRMNEWKRQCGYDLALIRYYPYVDSSASNGAPRKMPHSHKVERLIHIELRGAGLGVSDYGKCESCGRTHKEWFEIEATKEAVQNVDSVIKRWSDWDEQMHH